MEELPGAFARGLFRRSGEAAEKPAICASFLPLGYFPRCIRHTYAGVAKRSKSALFVLRYPEDASVWGIEHLLQE